MKIVISLLFFVVGILSFTNVEKLDVKKLCSKTGGPKAFANYERQKQKFQTYVESGVNEAREAEDKTAFVCNNVHSVKNHMMDVAESIKLCLEENQHQAMYVSANIAVSYIQFTCHNSLVLSEAFSSPGGRCAVTKYEAVKSCSDIFSVRFYNDLSSDTEPLATFGAILLASLPSFNSIDCSKILAFEQCITSVIKQCNDEVLDGILDSLYKYINNDIPCENLPKSTRSTASPTSVVSLMILFISLTTVYF